MPPFSHRTYARWGDLDANGHMANSTYLAHCGDVRMKYFAANGFPPYQFGALRVGSVVRRDDIEYAREFRLHDVFDVTLECLGMSLDGSRWTLRNRFVKLDGSVAATVTSYGGWLDLEHRRLKAPPAALLAAMQAMPRADEFAVLESSVKR